MLPWFWNNRLAKAWFSRSILSFSRRRTEIFKDLGPMLADYFFLYVDGPWTEDHLPCEISTSLLSRIAFSRFKSMFFSMKQTECDKTENRFLVELTVLIECFVLGLQCLFVVLLKLHCFLCSQWAKSGLDSCFFGHMHCKFPITHQF